MRSPLNSLPRILKHKVMLFLLPLNLSLFSGVLLFYPAPSQITFAQGTENRQTEADRLLQQGIQQFQVSQFREAAQSFEQALLIYREIGDRNSEASALMNLGVAYRSLSQYQQAIDYYQQALPIFQTTGDRNSEAKALMSLGVAYQSLSQYQQAIDYYQQALPIFQATGDRNGEAKALMNLGVAYGSLSQYQQEIDYYQQALPIFQTTGDRNSEAMVLGNLGAAYDSLSQYQQAIDYYQQALPIFQTTGDRNSEALTLMSLGAAYDSLSQYRQAIDYYQQALPILQTTGNRNSEAAVLMNLGNVHTSLSQYQQAIDYHQQALPIFQTTGNRNGEALTLMNLGSAYASLSQYQQAIDYYQQALPILQTTGDRNGVAKVLSNLGVAYASLSQYQQAIDYHQQALPILQTTGDRNGVASTLMSLGAVYDALRQYQEAIDYYQRALPIFQTTGDRAGQGLVLANLGKLLEQQQQPELAIAFLKQSVNVRESIRGEIRELSQEVQQSYTESVADDYRRLADLLLQQNRVLEAQQILDLLKLQEIEDYLQNVEGNEQTNQGVYVWTAEAEILALFEAAVEQNQAFEQFRQGADVTTRVATIQRDAQVQRIPANLLTSLQNRLRQLDHPAVLLYPLILDDRLELVLIAPNTPPIRRTVAVLRSELEQTIQQFDAVVRQLSANRRVLPLAQQLYDWLIRPLEADLAQIGAETILYASDGQLRYAPLAALHDGNQWLIERYRVNYITAASLTDFGSPRPHHQRVLAGAFSEGSHQFAIGNQTYNFAGLPYAGVEVANIARDIPDTTPLFNQAFSRTAIEPQMNQYPIVHFATHAELVPGLPEASFILLGNGDRVTLRDIADWSLPDVRLLVLSACRTAGQFAGNGSEILGFGFQIQQARVRAAIASLWFVSDGGTQVLMNAFYSGLSQGMTEAEALRQAQIALIRGNTGSSVPPALSDRLDHPYYWGPFILIGNGL